jgi:putative ABC transport system substrate-binding protein
VNRRAFVTGLGAVVAAPLAAEAQRATNGPIVDYLGGSAPSATAPLRAAFVRGLRDLGWIEGENITIEYRWASGNAEALGRAAAELVQLDVSVIVAGGTTVIRAAKDATSIIPIVMVGGGDPVGTGLVVSLAHPGGNITGISLIGGELLGKCLSLLHEAAPRVKRIAVLFNAANPANPFFLKELETTRRSLGVQLDALEVRSVDDVEAASARTQAGALLAPRTTSIGS